MSSWGRSCSSSCHANSPTGRPTLLLLGAGILANTISDSAFTFMQLAHAYGNYGNVIDAGWVLGYALIALGALRAAGREAPAVSADRLDRFSILLPYGPV